MSNEQAPTVNTALYGKLDLLLVLQIMCLTTWCIALARTIGS
jgi:hypothetical protein